MRSFLLAMTIAIIPTLAQAQGWGMNTSHGPLNRGSFSTSGISAHWDRCTNAQRTYEPAVSIESCDRLLAQSDSSPSSLGAIYWYRAMRNLDAGQRPLYEDDLKRAGEVFSAYVADNPRRYDGYVNRAAVLVRLGELDLALADYERAAALESRASEPWQGRGGVLFRRGDYAGANAAYNQAARIAARMATTDSGHHSTRCVARAALRESLDEAEALCNRAVRNADNPSGALTARGYLHFVRGDMEAAAADFGRAAETDPYSASAIYGRGVVAVRQGRTAEGEADMARGASIDQYEVDFYANAGLRP
jgi:tetratricopeptide (TPR) repeat protein